MFRRDFYDLEKQYVYYASYHNHPINAMIHIICIWPILATAIFMLQVRKYEVDHTNYI